MNNKNTLCLWYDGAARMSQQRAQQMIGRTAGGSMLRPPPGMRPVA